MCILQMPERWEDVRVTVIRPGLTDPDGPCANAIPQDDNKIAIIQRGKLSYCQMWNPRSIVFNFSIMCFCKY